MVDEPTATSDASGSDRDRRCEDQGDDRNPGSRPGRRRTGGARASSAGTWWAASSVGIRRRRARRGRGRLALVQLRRVGLARSRGRAHGVERGELLVGPLRARRGPAS